MIKVDCQAIKEDPICVEINNVNRNSFCKRCYPINFGKILRAPILKNIHGRLILYKAIKVAKKNIIKYIEAEYQLNFYERKKSDESF